MISEANGSDKAYTVTEEQFAQVLTRATNLWYLINTSVCSVFLLFSFVCFAFEYVCGRICMSKNS
jgi:hypothetical protein